MILSCPDCGTRFAIDADKLRPDGRRVKCGKCAHVWFESAPEPEPEPEADTFDDPPLSVTPLEPEEQSPIPPRNLPAIHRAKKARSARIGWLAVVTLLAAILAVLWFGRAQIATIVPQAEGIYAAVGLPAFPPPGEGLEIEFDPKTENGSLTLKGEIINTTSGVRDVPGLRVLITDAKDQTLKEWTFVSDVARLGPGETAAFTTSTDSVPDGAANVSILFTNSDENR